MRVVVLGWVVVAVGCAGAMPSRPSAAPLEIPPLPKSAAPVPAAPPMAVASAPRAGKCKDPVPGDAAPPTTSVPIAPGRVTVFFFWATWCAPCLRQFPKYEALNAKYHAQGLDIVGASVDDEEAGVKEFVQKTRAKFTTGWDRDRRDAECWRPATMPTTYVIDRSGVVRFIHASYQDGDAAQLEQEISGLL